MDPWSGYGPWLILLAGVVWSLLLACAATWPVCALILALYRRRIARGMRPAGVPVTAEDPAQTAPGQSRRIVVREADPRGAPALLQRARARARRSQVVAAGLGLVYGLTAAVAFQLVSGDPWHPLRVLAYTMLGGWLIVPTVTALAPSRSRFWWLAGLGYLAVVATLLTATGDAVLLHLLIAVAVPGSFVVATSARPLRGAAWLVAPALMLLGVTVACWLQLAIYRSVALAFDQTAWIALAVGIATPLMIIGYGWAMVRCYRAKWVGDQTLLILQWWFVLALWWTLLLGTQGVGAIVVGMAPYALLVVLVLIITALHRGPTDPPVRLLLLRTFGERERSSRLLHDLTRQWRWIGSVELITAPDLASETLEPDEFLDFVRGRLDRRFVVDETGLDRQLAELDLDVDRDGRFRVNEFMCADQTWQRALDGLVDEVDVVVVDLRSFGERHTGVEHEVRRLVALQPLSRVVGIVDQTTDTDALASALARAAELAPPSSPLHGDPDPALRVVGWTRSSDNVGRVMRAVAEGAGAPQRRGGTEVPGGAAQSPE